MFDEFEAEVKHNPPKLYQKSLYITDDGQITKIAVIFFAIILIFSVSVSAYMLQRSLRSKRVSRADEYTE